MGLNFQRVRKVGKSPLFFEVGISTNVFHLCFKRRVCIRLWPVAITLLCGDLIVLSMHFCVPEKKAWSRASNFPLLFGFPAGCEGDALGLSSHHAASLGGVWGFDSFGSMRKLCAAHRELPQVL